MSHEDAWVDKIITAILVGAFVVTSIIGAIVLSSNVLNPMVVKIMRGDLPPCNETVGTSDGYYCQINNASFFCKVDATQPDPYVRTHAYCSEVVFV